MLSLFYFSPSLAIIQLVLMAIGRILHPWGSFTIQAGVTGDRLYDFYGLGVTDKGYTLRFGNLVFARLQSFADEPGTFAAALMPALIWAVYKGWKIAILIGIIALLLTLSFGGLWQLSLLVLLALWKERKKIILVTSFLTILSLANSMAYSAEYLSERLGPLFRTVK